MDAMQTMVNMLAHETKLALIKHSDMHTASKLAGLVAHNMGDPEAYAAFGKVIDMLTEPDPEISVYVLRKDGERIDVCGNLPSVLASMQDEIDAFESEGYSEAMVNAYATSFAFTTEHMAWRDLYFLVASMVAQLEKDNPGILWPEPIVLAMSIAMEAMR
jgi:hypothetical protein